MQDCIWQLTSVEYSPYYFLNGEEPPRLGNGHSAMIPCNLYPTRDSRVFIAAGVLSQVHRLYTAMERTDLIDSPLGGNQNIRYPHRAEIDEAITQWTQTKTSDEILTLLKKADVPCSKLPAYSEVCENEQLKSRDMIVEVEQMISGKVKTPGSPFKLSKTPGKIDYPAPFLGQNSSEILSELLGYSDDEINKLFDAGVL
jgi:CoA:oxalate CoA-transferase